MNKRTTPMEAVFDILYLSSVLCLGGILIIRYDNYFRLWGIMSLILVFGDSFHLVPRIIMAFKDPNQSLTKVASIGKIITSITMSIFYVVLWHIGLIVYGNVHIAFTVLLYVLAFFRILLCLMPQNNWSGKSPYRWTILRNIPFVMQGVMVFLLFLLNSSKIPQLSLVYLAILFSFLFYLPIIIWGHKYPKLGMLMMPKSLAYVWIVVAVLI